VTWLFLKNCVFIEEFSFNINMRPSNARSVRVTPVIVTTPPTKAVSHSLLVAISAFGALNIEMRIPQFL
jgi:hypothetical protein